MAISITWGTKVINVPQADLTPKGGDVYELDADTFRLALKALEDDEAGIAFPDTHNHNTEVILGGVTYARTIEIINGYTITFENGSYIVDIVGANTNIIDVANLNSVSLRSHNSAGLQIVSVGSGLSAEESTQLDELHKIHGLDVDNDLVVTPTTRTAGAGVQQTISGDGETSTTVSRDT